MKDYSINFILPLGEFSMDKLMLCYKTVYWMF
ncbi:hypothetical protein C7447_101746 [Tenacibaculum adriaticum]|uniref:Uncharacterized protein n=1 Tax=Tenacibaculum adriaticum TaxID=413713 RepID=A0A5S5DYM3_9FLAO|nr:hypothetical protein C7447_101746 [Tenacibaculum adriaticum]